LHGPISMRKEGEPLYVDTSILLSDCFPKKVHTAPRRVFGLSISTKSD
jgi:hypothetical protein